MHSSQVEPTSAAVRRAVARAERGATLDADEIGALLAARGEDLARLRAAAVTVRDASLHDRGQAGLATYSPKVFVPLTHLCRDRCHYCTFVATPATLGREDRSAYLEIDEAVGIAAQGAALGCTEALLTLGDRPEARWPAARRWLDERGYDSTLGYVRAVAVAVLERTGLLPHLNPGVMSWSELARLKPVAPSMGMMLETTSRRLFTERGQPHFGSPDKDPAVRLRVLEDAGRLAIPFTSGLLVGIGETYAERADTLLALRRVAREHGHLQEVIVQNFRAKPDTALRHRDDLGTEAHLAAVATARMVLPPAVAVQAPPNLTDILDPDLGGCTALLASGVDDFGGVSPLTPDHVNPERPWPSVDRLAEATERAGLTLRPRLTAHPAYVRSLLEGGHPWIDQRLRPHVAALSRPDGLARTAVRPEGLPWQEPDGGLDGTGQVDLHLRVDAEGRSSDRRGDFDVVYGDWTAVAAAATAATTTGPDRSAAPDGGTSAAAAVRTAGVADRATTDDLAALAAAERDPGGLSAEHALTLMQADGLLLREVCAYADHLRRETAGDDVTYVVNRNINFTNVCYVGCRFCAFAQRRSDADAYALSLDQVADRAAEAWDLGATEVCMQGGIDPSLPSTAYADLAAAVKRRVPEVHVHAFSPMEVMSGASRAGLSVEDFLINTREAGLDSIPGTAAEILDDEVRWALTKGKLPTSAWVDVVTTAHRLGIPSTSTMMYGHVDHPRHWVAHLQLLARLQDQAREHGAAEFTEFVPLPFVHHAAPLYLAGIARPGPTMRDNLAVHAMARILLHGRIDNIQTSWVKLGVDGTQAMLRAGANDLGGTLMEETISRMAGSPHGSAKTPVELEEIGAGIGRPVVQRLTDYAPV